MGMVYDHAFTMIWEISIIALLMHDLPGGSLSTLILVRVEHEDQQLNHV